MPLRPILLLAALAWAASECRAIEMWTFYGDGSRIGLPSLEVPVEAYPGIPLRSDRIRMRRRGQRTVTPAPAGRTGVPGSITLRPAPAGTAPVAPAPEDVLGTGPR